MVKKETLHIYVRVSDDRSAKKDNSIVAQKEAGEKVADAFNFTSLLEREGDSQTGTGATKDNLVHRPVLKRLLILCQQGMVKNIFCTEWDRLARNPKIAVIIFDIFKRHGIKLYDTHRVYDIKGNPQDELLLGINNVLSQHEIRLKNERIIRSLGVSARKGKWSGGVMLPYGFRRQANKIMEGDDVVKIINGIMEFHPEEAKVVRRIFELSLEGKGSATIAKMLNDAGVATKGRKNLKNGIKRIDRITGETKKVKPEDIIWRPGTVLGILKNPLYKGERHYKGSVLPIQPMIDPIIWQKVQDNLKKNNINAQRNNKVHFYLLKGMITCKKCGKGMYGVIKPNRGMRIYMCVSKRTHECDMKSVNIDRLNDVVWDNFKNSNILLTKAIEELKEGKSDIQSKDIIKKINGLQKRIDNLKNEQKTILALFGKGKISEDRFDERDKELENEQLDLHTSIDGFNKELVVYEAKKNLTFPTLDLYNEIMSNLDNKTEEEKREILKRYVHQVIIDYDPTEPAHIVSVVFDLELKLAPLVYSIPNRDKAWEFIGYELGDGILAKPQESEEGNVSEVQEIKSPIVTPSHH